MPGLSGFNWSPRGSDATHEYVSVVPASTSAVHSTKLPIVPEPKFQQSAPNATGVVFQMYKPPGLSSTQSAKPSSTGGMSRAALIGCIAGIVMLVVAVLIVCVVRRNKLKLSGQYPKVEMGKVHRHNDLSTDEVIDEAKRMRAERQREKVTTTDQQIYHAWHTADRLEMTRQNDVIAADHHRRMQREGRGNVDFRPSYGVDPSQLAQAQGWDSPFGADSYQSRSAQHTARAGRSNAYCQSHDIDPSRLAQAQGWESPFGADTFQSQSNRHTSRAGRSNMHSQSHGIDPSQLAQAQGWGNSFGADNYQSQYNTRTSTNRVEARCPPPLSTTPSTLDRHRSRTTRHGNSTYSPVSPVKIDSGTMYMPRGRVYDDVSPIGSTRRAHGYGWPR